MQERIKPGSSFDAAPFGMSIADASGLSYGIQWGEPRKIRRVEIEFAKNGDVPDPGIVALEYWHRVWDGKPDPILSERGAGGVGWAAMDDWTNGKWRKASAVAAVNGRILSFTFAPTGDGEFENLGVPGVAYRKTLKLRISSSQAFAQPVQIRTYTDAVWRPVTLRLLWGAPASDSLQITDGGSSGRVEAYNGRVLAVRPLVKSGPVKVAKDLSWSVTGTEEDGIEADLLMAVDPVDERYDNTIVTFRLHDRPVSVAAEEIARGERILIDDLGLLVTRGDDQITLADYRQARTEFPGRSVYDRVFDESEQTLSRAWNDMPLKRPFYFIHGVPGNRNAVRQEPNGEVLITSSHHWFSRPKSSNDTERKLWGGERLSLDFGFPDATTRGGRELRDGHLPLLKTWWQHGPLLYVQETILDTLSGDWTDIQGDDPTVLLMRVRVLNTSKTETATATLEFTSRDDAAEKLSINGNGFYALSADEGPQLRFLIQSNWKGSMRQGENSVDWSLKLTHGQSVELDFAIPTITLAGNIEIDALRKRDFDDATARILDWWTMRSLEGTQINTPEVWINDFYKSHLRHMLVNCQREVGADRLHAHVGTFGYGVYPDESCMMISDLDRRGYAKEAELCLESFLEYQGTVQMPGNFKSKEGLFYGSGGHDTGGYNKSHGWVLWNMAEHWNFTRDRAWMERAAPKLVAGCDWVTNERQATMIQNADGSRPIEYGWLPTGSLEDVTDYWHWMVTNACTVWGMRALADALTDFGHPEAARLQQDAQAYYDDFMRSMEEARVTSPVVKLRDGTYVPHFPSRLHERGRCYGWLRETLEGAIHLPITDLIDPESRESAWILKDFEDNLYISEQYGYAIPVFESFWFSRGGFSMQANLLGGPLPYLYRDEIKHFLRGYFNGFASAFYPETRMFNEHSLPELGYPAGDHFKSSDEAQSTYWLRLMFVHERKDNLYLGYAIPRYWLTDGKTVGIERAASHYGPVSLSIESHVNSGEIRAIVDPPARNYPTNLFVRLRHPESKPIQSVTVNGQDYPSFDKDEEWIALPGKVEGRLEIVAKY